MLCLYTIVRCGECMCCACVDVCVQINRMTIYGFLGLKYLFTVVSWVVVASVEGIF